MTVIDCVNFAGYADRSPTAKMQARYTDLLLLNKHEQVTERQLDLVVDRVNDLNEDTPRVLTNGTNGVSRDLVLGLSATGTTYSHGVVGDDGQAHRDHMNCEVDMVQVRSARGLPGLTLADLHALFASLPADRAYRIKGLALGYAFNYAFGRPGGAQIEGTAQTGVELMVLGDDLAGILPRLKDVLGLNDDEIRFTPRHDHRHHDH